MASIPAAQAPIEPKWAPHRLLWIGFCAFSAFLALNGAVLGILRLADGGPAPLYVLFVALPCILLAFLLLFFFRKRTVIYGYVIALIVALYGAQQYILWNEYRPADKYEAVMEARGRGIDAIPSVHPSEFYWRSGFSLPVIDGRSVLPLAGISHMVTYFCKEADPFLTYESDRYGFNNPDAAWQHRSELAFLGDSFTQGACVPSEKHFTGILRPQFPGLLNVGGAGNGPLAALATLQEYVAAMQPDHVFWSYYDGNDVFLRPESRSSERRMSDMEAELGIPILVSYLENPEFGQDLKDHQAQIDRTLHSLVEEAVKDHGVRQYQAFVEKITLGPLARTLINSLPEEYFAILFNAKAWLLGTPLGRRDELEEAAHGPQGKDATAAGERLYVVRRVLERMRTIAESWGGEFHLIYLPSVEHFRFGPHPLREEMLSLAQQLQISVIDMVPLFEAESDPKDLFAFDLAGHYSARGYGLVARAIAQTLSAQGQGVTSASR